MNVLIIEDELPARAKLIQMLGEIVGKVNVVGETGSVKESVAWLKSNPSPDIAFVDIQLSDDHSFEIFRQCQVPCPVIFTTAFDKYVLESFAYNSVDYLLKPITTEKLERAIEKIRSLEKHFLQQQVTHLLSGEVERKQIRIIGKKGTEFMALDVSEIAYFYTDHKIVFVRDTTGRTLIVDNILTELETMLKPHDFFRINRKFLAQAKAIEKYKSDNGKLLVALTPSIKEDVFVSKETAPAFRKWIGQRQ